VFLILKIYKLSDKLKRRITKMKKINWSDSLKKWSEKRLELLGDRKIRLPPQVLADGYLGYPGASEQEITAAEAYLDLTLPPSYREFLKVSNGLRLSVSNDFRFYSVQEIYWFKFSNQVVIDAWIEAFEDDVVTDEEYFVYGDEQGEFNFRPEYLQTALQISSEDLEFVFLLNPQIITSDGEWEAWFFGMSTAATIARYRSFGELMLLMFSDPGRFC